MTHFDPSWCARMNAHRAADAPAAEPRLAPADAPPPEPVEAPSPPPVSADGADAWRTAGHACDLCGSTMYEHNCKIVCPNCGYKRDCTDP